MHADDFVIDDSCTREAVKSVAKLLPDLDREPATALVIETVDAVDAGALMVAAEDEEIFGVFNLVGEKEADNF